MPEKKWSTSARFFPPERLVGMEGEAPAYFHWLEAPIGVRTKSPEGVSFGAVVTVHPRFSMFTRQSAVTLRPSSRDDMQWPAFHSSQ